MDPTVSSPTAAPSDADGAPPGPLTSAELAAAVPDSRDRRRYVRIWHGMYRREDQADDLLLRSRALARIWPEGVLRGRSAALLWGDDSAPADALPEIWLPRTRRSTEGRIYRYGSMPPVAVTEVDGLRVTTPLRTCRDLAADLEFEDAVVAVERLCAAVPELPALLAAVPQHPSGRGGRGFAAVAGAVDMRSGSVASTRARVALAAAGCGDFRPGHTIRLGERTLELPLADLAARCVVFTPGGPATPSGWADPVRSRTRLRRAGWTVIVLRGDAEVAGSSAAAAVRAELEGSVAGVRTAVKAGSGVVGGDVSSAAMAALRARWARAEMHPPLEQRPADDPHGMWSPGTC